MVDLVAASPDLGGLLPDIAICVPARNEAAELPALFGALERLKVDGARVAVCLLLDACTDGSLALANAYRGRSRHHVVVAQAASASANAGRARHNAMALGAATLTGTDGLLLTTDADTAPANDWLPAMMFALARAEVVAGLIGRRTARPNGLQDRLEAYYDALFALRRRLDPVPWEAKLTHHFCGGANLGIRRSAYERLGGFLPMANGEDARLLDDASRAGLRVRRDAACVVHTSDRREGRATGGLAAALEALDSSDATQVCVTHPADAAWQYRMQADARAAHRDNRLAAFAMQLNLTHDHVRGVERDCPNAEAFAMRIVPTPPNGMRSVALPNAEMELARLVDLRVAA